MDPLITAGDLDDYLQRPVPPPLAALAVAGASGIVRSHCRWNISREEAVTFKVDGSGTTVLSLPTLHITDVTAVTVDGETVDLDDVYWLSRGQLHREQGWPRWARADVECDSGYTDIPDVIKIVALSLAARYIGNPQALKSATVGAVQRVYAAPQPNSLELALLDSFRLP